jgi:hypothetical protein
MILRNTSSTKEAQNDNATATKKIPTITATSTENFYDVLSSDGSNTLPHVG